VSAWTDRLTAVSTAAAAVFAMLAFAVSCDSLATSNESFGLARQNEERQKRQEAERYANQIYLGEAPIDAYRKHSVPKGELWYVVVNASDVQAENVWVTNKDGLSINIWGLQRCAMYAFPSDFRPEHLYFTDPNRVNWHRKFGGAPEQLPDDQNRPRQPERDTGGDSVWFDSIQDCGA
jgi:hypothetical protein